MASTLTAAELPQPERGVSVVQPVAVLGPRLAHLAARALRIVVALAGRTDLDAAALIGVESGVQKVRDGLDQICAACAPPRELEGVDGGGDLLAREQRGQGHEQAGGEHQRGAEG